MDNLIHYNNLKTVPLDALKEIGFGKLKGKKDINPQWRYEALTKEFGPCGFGWKFEITNTWTVPVEKEVMLFVQLNLYVKRDDEWSEPIPATGGDFLLIVDKNGLHGNDEAYKMATTDALGVAAKMLGVAGDVYRGLADDSKYGRIPPKPPQSPPVQQNQPVNTNTPQQQKNVPTNQNKPTPDQVDKAIKEIEAVAAADKRQAPIIKWETFYANVKNLGLQDHVKEIAAEHYKRPVESLKDVIDSQQELNKFMSVVAKYKQQPQTEESITEKRRRLMEKTAGYDQD